MVLSYNISSASTLTQQHQILANARCGRTISSSYNSDTAPFPTSVHNPWLKGLGFFKWDYLSPCLETSRTKSKAHGTVTAALWYQEKKRAARGGLGRNCLIQPCHSQNCLAMPLHKTLDANCWRRWGGPAEPTLNSAFN